MTSDRLLDPTDELRLGPELARFDPYVFTGSRTRPPWKSRLTESEQAVIAAQVDRLADNALVLTGGAKGVDAIVNRRAIERNLPRVVVLPASVGWTDWEAISAAVVIRTRMAPPDRDRVMVNAARHCVAIGLYEPGKDPRSGTWTTARLAQRRGILERIIVLRPKSQDHPLIEEGNDVCVCHPAACACVLGRMCSCAHHRHHPVALEAAD